MRPQVSLLVRGKLSKGRHEVICVCFYSKTPQRLRNGAQQKSVTAQPNLTQLSFSNTDKETSVSIVSNTHHMTVLHKHAVTFNSPHQMILKTDFQ